MPMPTKGLEKGVYERNAPETKDRYFVAYQKDVDLATRTVQVVASALEIDRDGEAILPRAFEKTLPIWLASHAPIQTQHTHRTSDGSPAHIGWGMTGKIQGVKIFVDLRFTESDEQDSCERWWKRVKDPKGKGIAVSIGFMPSRWVYGSVADLVKEFPELRGPIREAGLNDDDRLRVYTEIELYEISPVGVPSNRGALQVLAAKGFALEPEADADEAGQKAFDALVERIAKRLAELAPKPVAATLEEAPAAGGITEKTALSLIDAIEMFIACSPDPINAVAPAPGGPGAGSPADRAGDGKKGADAGQASAGRLLAKLNP